MRQKEAQDFKTSAELMCVNSIQRSSVCERFPGYTVDLSRETASPLLQY